LSCWSERLSSRSYWLKTSSRLSEYTRPVLPGPKSYVFDLRRSLEAATKTAKTTQGTAATCGVGLDC
jgi:hypothetical protein